MTLGRSAARLVLAAWSGLTIACLAASFSGVRDEEPRPTGAASSDFELYRKVVERVGAGDSYYGAAHQELRARGFPTRSVLNWRTPVYAWFLGRGVGLAGGRVLLGAGMLAVVVMGWRDLAEEFGAVPGAVGGVALVGSAAWCAGSDAVLLTEFWAAMLVGLSVCAYRRGWTAVAAAAGLVAVFDRELALPYAVVSAGLAFRNGRRREAAAWVLGLLAFAAFMGFHAYQVQSRITGADLASGAGWVQFGGLRFLLAAARMNVFFASMPPWWAALYLPLAVIGLAGSRGESGPRVGLTASLWLAVFAAAGKPFNSYWGFLIGPSLAMGVAGAPRALSGLIASSFGVAESRRPRRPEPVSGLHVPTG